MNKLLIVGNRIFIPIDSFTDDELEPKYLSGYISGATSLVIWTKAEILAKYPNIKECKSFLEVKEIWNTKD